MDKFKPVRSTSKNTLQTSRVVLGAMFLLFSLAACSGPAEVAAQDPVVEEQDMQDYVGSYGIRSISARNNQLSYMNDGMPQPVLLKEIGEDHFEFVIPPGARTRGAINGEFPTVRFNRDDDGMVASMSLIGPDGTEMGKYPKKSPSD